MEDRRRSPSRPRKKRIPLLLLRRGRFSQLDLQKRERRKVRVREIDGAALLDRTFLLFFFGNWQVNGREKGEKRNFKVKEEGVGEGSRKGGGGGLEGDKGGSVGRTDGPNLKRLLLPLPTPSPPGVSYTVGGVGRGRSRNFSALKNWSGGPFLPPPPFSSIANAESRTGGREEREEEEKEAPSIQIALLLLLLFPSSLTHAHSGPSDPPLPVFYCVSDGGEDIYQLPDNKS